MASMEYPSIDDLAEDYEFFGMGDFLTKDMAMEGGVALAASAGGILIAQNVMDRIEYFADKPAWRAAAELATALAGGRGLWNYNRAAAIGLLAGLGGLAAANLAQQGLAYAQERMDEAAAPAPVEGLRGRGRLGESTAVTPVPPYYDRYKTSVPRKFGPGSSPTGVSRANYFQTRGMGGVGESEQAPDGDGENGGMDEMPDVGTWLSGS